MATLYLVATPLGNLEDITWRAARILGEVDIVAAESLERAGTLLRHLGIRPKRLLSCREANRKRATADICNLLDQGQSVALISDAGSPGLNDPAAAVVKGVVAAGHKVSPIPGPSALAAAWSVAGIDHAPFAVLGFLPSKAGARKKLLEKCQENGWPFVFFEAPHRLADTAEALAEIMPQRGLVLCREMSKLYEQILHTTCLELVGELKQDPNLSRGEFTVVVDGASKLENKRLSLDDYALGLEQILHISQGLGGSQLAAFLSRESGIARDIIYKEITALKNKADI